MSHGTTHYPDHVSTSDGYMWLGGWSGSPTLELKLFNILVYFTRNIINNIKVRICYIKSKKKASPEMHF